MSAISMTDAQVALMAAATRFSGTGAYTGEVLKNADKFLKWLQEGSSVQDDPPAPVQDGPR